MLKKYRIHSILNKENWSKKSIFGQKVNIPELTEPPEPKR